MAKKKGAIIEASNDVDVFVMRLPDNTYVAVFPWPMCDCRHRSAEEAAECKIVSERIDEDKRNSKFVQRSPGYL